MLALASLWCVCLADVLWLFNQGRLAGAELHLAEFLEAEVLALNQTFEVCEGLTELLEDIGCAMTVARSVVLWVDRVHDYEHSLALGSLCIERPIVHLKLIPVNYSKKAPMFIR